MINLTDDITPLRYRTSLGWMMAAVLQLSVVRTLVFFITLVLWTDEQYDYGDVSLPQQVQTYLLLTLKYVEK